MHLPINIPPLIIGGFAALLAALLWAISAIIFRNLGKSIPPTELNLVKGCFAAILMLFTTLLMREAFPIIPLTALVLLIFSGVVGIGIGDTAYFESLNHLGSRIALLMAMLAPSLTGAFAWVFLGESIAAAGCIGVGITFAGIIWVITEEQSTDQKNNINYRKGIQFGVISALAQAIGAVITRYALTSDLVIITALQLSIIRILAGILYLVLFLFLDRKSHFSWLQKTNNHLFSNRRLIGMIVLVGFLGTYSAIWLQSLAIQYAPVAIAQTLLSTSPLFVLPIIALRGEKVSFRAVGGVILSLAGIIMLFSMG